MMKALRLGTVGLILLTMAGMAWQVANAQSASYDTTLTWTAPTQNTDGTPLTDLAGYNVYYGVNPDPATMDLLATVPCEMVGGPASCVVQSHVVAGATFTPNTTYYFAMTSENALGLESVFSNVASKTMPNTLPPEPPTGFTVEVTINVPASP
jgi:hypothetical protein